MEKPIRQVSEMKVNAELYVRDLPGQLVGSLEPISMVNGNIVGVVHDREQMVNDRILVSVTFEVDTAAQLDELKDIWKSLDIQIGSMGSVGKTYPMDYLILGKFDGSYLDTLIEGAAKTVHLESVDVGYSARDTKDSKRSAMISVEVSDRADVDKLDVFFDESCRKNKLVLIKGVLR